MSKSSRYHLMISSIISSLSSRHHQTMAALHHVDIPVKKASFALGCFWGCDSLYGATKGVVRTRVGYCGGTKTVPTYRNIGDYTEAIEVDYNPNEVSYESLLNLFWSTHDATAKMKKQYTSIIFYHDKEQKSIAERSKKEKEATLKNIVTAVTPVTQFYNAEDYHQKYRLQQHPFLMEALNLKPNTADLIQSHVAARLNGYVVGFGGVQQFEEEKTKLGLDERTADYVRNLVTRYEGCGITC